jgi:hypothetical protein
MSRSVLYTIGCVLGTAFFLAGCGNGQSTGGQGALPSDSGALADVEVPTAEEAEAAAAAEITEANVDEAMRDLEAEIESELGELGEP